MQQSNTCLTHKQSISYICFDQKCIQSSEQIMCKKCSDQHNVKYKNHRVIQYELFIKYLQTLKREIDYNELKEIIKDQFSIFKNDIHQHINNFEDSILSSISLDFNQEHQFQIFQGQISLITKNQLFRKFVTNPSSIGMIKEEEKSRNIYLLKQIRALNQDLKRLIQNTKKQLFIAKIQKNFVFSNKFKHQNIQVLNGGISIKRIEKEILGHSQLAVCKQPFTPINNQIQFVIKDMSARACIAVGACVLPAVQKNNYYRCFQLGQGTYSLFMNTFGTVKCNHHTNKNFSNSHVKLWKFRKGDVIKVQIDFMKEKIIFQKNKTDHFEMPIHIQGQKLYPFAALSYSEDIVQIK